MSTAASPSQREDASSEGYKERLDEAATRAKNPQKDGNGSNEGIIAQTVEKGITYSTPRTEEPGASSRTRTQAN